MDTMESVKQKPSLKLIHFIYTVVCMDIMDMLDTHTPMDTMDTMDMLVTLDILDTPMFTMDRYPHQQMTLTQKMDTNHCLLSSSVTFIFQCLTVIQ